MPVSGYIVAFDPQKAGQAHEEILAIGGIECGEAQSDSMPIAVFAETSKESERIENYIRNLDAIKNITLVYHNYEDTDEVTETN